MINDVRACAYVNLLCLSKKLMHNLIISTITESLMELCYTGKENLNVLFKRQYYSYQYQFLFMIPIERTIKFSISNSQAVTMQILEA